MAAKITMRQCDACAGTGKVPALTAGEQLRAFRLDKGVSLRRLATAMNISPQYLADLELGRRNLSRALAEDYQVALENISQ